MIPTYNQGEGFDYARSSNDAPIQTFDRFELKGQLINALQAHEWLGHFIAAALADDPAPTSKDEDAFLKT